MAGLPSSSFLLFCTTFLGFFGYGLFQNLPPKFAEPNGDLQEQLVNQGILENATVGTVIGELKCIDPENDTVVYNIEAGSGNFRVNFVNGKVTLKTALDRENSVNSPSDKAKPLRVKFQCVDYDVNGNSLRREDWTSSDLVVTVRDTNDNAPVFSTGNSFTVQENAPIGTKITGFMNITDLDLGSNARLASVNFSCDPKPGQSFDQDVCNVFELRTTQVTEGIYTVEIVTRAQVDYETKTDYNPEIIAIDGSGNAPANKLTSSIAIRIDVIDRQDTPPEFTNRNYNLDIDERLQVGTQVNFFLSAKDGDEGNQRPINFTIEDDGVNLFEPGTATIADPAQGIYQAQLTVRSPIDRESLPTGYNFLAKATELENGVATNQTATKRFFVNIRDLNDNTPTFDNPVYSINATESLASQIPGIDIVVTDLDQPSNARFRVEIEAQPFDGTFVLRPTDIQTNRGRFYLFVNNPTNMDYERPQFRRQQLRLKAIEVDANGRDMAGRTGTALVVVNLLDINDNSPVFMPLTYTSSIRETVNPANFAPTFLLRVTASDADTGVNAQLEYGITSNQDVFRMDANSGNLTLIAPLNYEDKTTYVFSAYARDISNSPRSAIATITINVLDFNDDGPVFTQDVYNGRVNERSNVFEVPVRVQAFDKQANITYRIIGGNIKNQFVLDPITGVLSLRPDGIVFEDTPNAQGIVMLQVEASDNENPPVTSQSTIQITVVDQNNFPPRFDSQVYRATVSEAEAPGTSILTVTATDGDSGTNGEITYRIGTGSRDNFVVYRNGTVAVSNFPSFDYDDYQSMNMQIFATDGGSPQQSATATIQITITDANNKPPSFVQDLYQAIVNETSPVGLSVLQVRATDPDAGHMIRYRIDQASIIAISPAGARFTSTNDLDYRISFSIDAETGVIRIGDQLNRNYVVEMSFDVVAEDKAPNAVRPELQNDKTRVTITINGQPDRELFFRQPWSKNNPVYTLDRILESTDVDKRIFVLEAFDPLTGSAVSQYEEVPDTDSGNYFRVDPQGDVRLNRRLDYESGDNTHSVVVRGIKTITTNGRVDSRTVSATISLFVQDANDNAPRFTKSSYKFTVPESANTNYFVGDLLATDQDSATYGPITFTLGGGLGTDDFKLVVTTDLGKANLLVAKQLDFETRSIYSFVVTATDNANGEGNSLATSTFVEVQVTDENDNWPEFADVSRKFSVSETEQVNTGIGRVVARDQDTGTNGDVSYSLSADFSTTNGFLALVLFRITRSGELVVKSSLRGRSSEYQLKVEAMDAGVPPKAASIPITIKVLKAEDDDGTPQFFRPDNNHVVLVEEHNKTRLDVDINALARTPNASIEYSIAPFFDYQQFYINPVTGDVNVTGDLDYEVQPEYTIVIQATDTLNRTMIKRRTLHVRLIDIDDNEPSFKKSAYAACPIDFPVPKIITVMDKTPLGRVIGDVEACDPDGPGNDRAEYILYTGNTYCQKYNSGDFTIDRNGSIVTAVQMKYEVQSEYMLCVTFRRDRSKRDAELDRQNNTATVAYVQILVQDINDNGPSFPLDQVTAVLETIPPEDFVTQVLANDPDSPQNSQTSYAIVSSMYHPPNSGRPYSLRGAFDINSENGIISNMLPSYEDFVRGHFKLVVSATDVANSSMSDTTTVVIVIYQRSQLLRVVLDISPSDGQVRAPSLIREMNRTGAPDVEFFFKSVSEHRTSSEIVATQTDICFVVVDGERPLEASDGISLLDQPEYRNILTASQYSMVDRGTCYPLASTESQVKWRDLWWVLVFVAIFIFVCCLILIVTVCILFDRYKNYMKTEKTYMVPG